MNMLRNENNELKNEINELKNEINELKKLKDSGISFNICIFNGINIFFEDFSLINLY